MTSYELDLILYNWGIARGPDETDEHLRLRARMCLSYPTCMNRSYLHLCLLLHKLDVKTARRDLPIGVL
jgi:hypothetical protein